MASTPQQPTLPIFYNDVIPLNSNDHKGWRLRPSAKAPFLAKQHAVPLTVDEFVSAQRSMPIVFSAGTDPVPLALMGLNEGINTLVEDDGAFRTDRQSYVPAYVRRYPWLLVRLREDSEDLSLCFDPTSDVLGAFDEGEPLLQDDGQPTQTAQAILKFCEEFEQAVMRTGQFVRDLKELDLLTEGEVAIQMAGNDQPFVYRGFQVVNEEKLRDLRGDQLRKISQNGMLPLLHAHLFSLQLMSQLFDLQIAQGKGPVAQN